MLRFKTSHIVFAGRGICIAIGLVCYLTHVEVFAKPAGERRPNIVFFIADDMQRYMCNFLAESETPYLTPNLDRLAGEGTLLMQQYVSAPVCTPSRFSCLTGRYASRSRHPMLANSIKQHGQSVVGWNTKIMPGETTIASQLSDAGYKTGMVGKNHVIDVPGREQVGYREDPRDDSVHARLEANQETVCQGIKRAGFEYAASIYHNNPDGNGPRALAVHNLDWITQGGLRFIDQAKNEPFFLYFASTVPHGPGDANRSWKADRSATAAGFLPRPLALLPTSESISQRLSDAGLPVDNRRANMLWLDDALGALIARLRKHELLDNTIIFFFNDHGQAAKGTLYQGGVNNPSLVWRQGGFPCGPTSTARISNVDFAPTILELAGVELPTDRFDGISFQSVLMGDAGPTRDSLYFEMGFSRAVIKGDWKYLALRYPESAIRMSAEERHRALDRFNEKQNEHGKRIVTTDPSSRFSHISLIPGGGGAEAASTGKKPGYYDANQLYNLAADPGEQNNLADDPRHANVLEEMKSELQRYLNDLPGGFAELDRP